MEAPASGTMWGEPLARRMFRDAGFDGVEVKHVAGDPTDIYYILRRQGPVPRPWIRPIQGLEPEPGQVPRQQAPRISITRAYKVSGRGDLKVPHCGPSRSNVSHCVSIHPVTGRSSGELWRPRFS